MPGQGKRIDESDPQGKFHWMSAGLVSTCGRFLFRSALSVPQVERIDESDPQLAATAALQRLHAEHGAPG